MLRPVTIHGIVFPQTFVTYVVAADWNRKQNNIFSRNVLVKLEQLNSFMDLVYAKFIIRKISFCGKGGRDQFINK